MASVRRRRAPRVKQRGGVRLRLGLAASHLWQQQPRDVDAAGEVASCAAAAGAARCGYSRGSARGAASFELARCLVGRVLLAYLHREREVGIKGPPLFCLVHRAGCWSCRLCRCAVVLFRSSESQRTARCVEWRQGEGWREGEEASEASWLTGIAAQVESQRGGLLGQKLLRDGVRVHREPQNNGKSSEKQSTE